MQVCSPACQQISAASRSPEWRLPCPLQSDVLKNYSTDELSNLVSDRAALALGSVARGAFLLNGLVRLLTRCAGRVLVLLALRKRSLWAE